MAFEQLRELRCFPQVLEKITAGVSCESVGEWMQEEAKEYTHVQLASLVRLLYRFKESIPANQLAIPQPLYLHNKIEKLKRSVNEVEELEKLYLAQLSRISMAMETEDKIKFLNNKLFKDIETAKGLLIEMARLKMELGLYKRTPLALDLSGRVEHTHKEFLDNLEPDRRRKLGEVSAILMDGLKNLIAGPAEPGLPVQDADWEFVESRATD